MSDCTHAELVERLDKLLAHFEARPELLEEKEQPPELVIYFDPPIKGALGKEYDAITLREPTVKEFRDARKASKGKEDPDFAMGCALIRMVSGTTDELVDALPITKLMEAQDYVTGFFEAGPRTPKR